MKAPRSLLFFAILMSAPLVSCHPHDSSAEHPSAGPARQSIETMAAGFSADRLRTHIEYLSADELEGRSPGSEGEALTLDYLAEQYREMGLSPGNPDGSFLQEVPLIGSTVINRPPLRLESGDGVVELRYMEDFMGWTLRKQENVSVDDAELVFVGYGIVAPEYDWNDYKDVDVAGKVIVMLVGDPPLPDTTLFGGRAMTYYGRWTYKFEIAAEKGAAGAIVIHEDAAAGYPWEVVSNSWSGEQFDIERPGKGADRCALESWITTPSATRVFEGAGLELAHMYESALSREFRPVPLGINARCAIRSTFRNIRSYNLVARLEGTDAKLKDECIIYTAHWDHLGMGNPAQGDSIYNGALDNATGVAATLEIARAFVANRRLARRSILFVNTTGEESGLLGSKHYAEHPLYPLASTVAMINIDGLNVWGRTKDVVVIGYGFSDLDQYLGRAIRAENRYLKPDSEPEKGYYYRSDHFPFAKKGVPALYADSGTEFVDRPGDWGSKVRDEYTRTRYHKPQDEFDPEWNLSGAVEDLNAYFRVGMMIAAADAYPRWSARSEFREIRERSLRASGRK
ncbi:MAG: M28 family metallopeptidase [Candidatus Krumholzibacteriia bacterium]